MEEKTKQVTHKPLFGRVLIKREKLDKSKSGLIIVPESAAKRNAPREGIIVALGETAGWVQVPEQNELTYIRNLNIGDKVMFGTHAGAWVDASEGNDDGTLFICQDQDILSVMEAA